MSAFQILPDLSPADYSALKADIAARGVMVPVEYDDAGNIIDGHHRVRICEELGIADWPRVVRAYPDDSAKRTQARKLNIARRHLDSAAKRALIEEELMENPALSNRHIAANLGVDDKTVSNTRKGLEATAEIPQLERTVGKDGKARPTQKKRGASKAAESGKPDTERRNSWVKARVPDGETLESVVRRGMSIEATGATPEVAAATVGIGILTYRRARGIICLSESKLRKSDTETVSRALADMNATSQIAVAFEIVEPVMRKVWGDGWAKEASGRHRRDVFDRAFGALVQICSTAAEIPIPYFTPEEAAAALAELAATEKPLRELKAKLREMTKDE